MIVFFSPSAPLAPSGTPAPDRRAPTVIALATLVALALRLAAWTRGEVWLDEACTAELAGRPWQELIDALLGSEAHPPVYYGLVHLLIGALGESAWVLRLPSLLAGVLLVPVTAAVAQRLAGPRPAAWTAWLVATSPLLAYYAVEARHYSLLTLWVSAAVALLLRPGRAAALGSALLMGLAAGTHFMALVFVPLPLLTPGRGVRDRLLRTAGWALASAPALALALGHLGRGTRNLAWLGTVDAPLRALWRALAAASPLSDWPRYLGHLGRVPTPALLDALVPALVLLLVVLALVPSPRRVPIPLWPSAWRPGARAFVVGWLTLGVILPLLVGMVRPLFLPGRYELAAVPGLLIALACGVCTVVSWVSHRASRVATWLGASLALAGLVGSALWVTLPRPDHARAEVAAVYRHAPGVVFCTELSCPTLAYALRTVPTPNGFQRPAPPRPWPPALAAHRCWVDPDEVYEPAQLAAWTDEALVDVPSDVPVAVSVQLRPRGIAGWAHNRVLLQALEGQGRPVVAREQAGSRGLVVFGPAAEGAGAGSGGGP